MLVDHWRKILNNNKKDKPKRRKLFRTDAEGNYWISTMRFTKGTLLALGIVAFIMAWFVVGVFYGNDNFFDNFSCGEVVDYLQGDKMGYVLHIDLPDDQHDTLHELVTQCKAEKIHEQADLVKEKGFDFGHLGELFN